MSDADSTFKRLIATVADGKSLSESEAVEAFNIMMSGEATQSQIAGFLIALRIRGETVEEITGAARIMREKALKVSAPDDAIDVVGTGVMVQEPSTSQRLRRSSWRAAAYQLQNMEIVPRRRNPVPQMYSRIGHKPGRGRSDG